MVLFLIILSMLVLLILAFEYSCKENRVLVYDRQTEKCSRNIQYRIVAISVLGLLIGVDALVSYIAGDSLVLSDSLLSDSAKITVSKVVGIIYCIVGSIALGVSLMIHSSDEEGVLPGAIGVLCLVNAYQIMKYINGLTNVVS